MFAFRASAGRRKRIRAVDDAFVRIVLAPNAFKGSLSAPQAARSMAKGARRCFPEAEIVELPIADGGDGTVEALVAATGGELKSARVHGPRSEPVEASYGLLEGGRVAVIEMARAAGLALVPPDRRDPRITTTYGVGELLQRAFDQGARRFIVGIGGSATNDGGAGLAQALGYHLLDEQGHELPPGGAALARVARIHVGGVHAAWKQAQVRVACDVTNPLTGPSGASAVYGPQKGASPEQVSELDGALRRLAEVIRRDLEVDVEHLPGAGAAGGLGAGLVAFTGARLEPGAELVLEALRFEERIRGADLVMTGEGRLDVQTTRYGKGPAAVARRAHRAGIPVIAIAGSLEDEPALSELFDGLEPLPGGPISAEEAMRDADVLLCRATERALRLIKAGKVRPGS